MNWLINFVFVGVSIFGAYLGAVISGEVPIVPKAEKIAPVSHASKIVRFSYEYACQKKDRACIANGIKEHSIMPKTGLSSQL